MRVWVFLLLLPRTRCTDTEYFHFHIVFVFNRTSVLKRLHGMVAPADAAGDVFYIVINATNKNKSKRTVTFLGAKRHTRTNIEIVQVELPFCAKKTDIPPNEDRKLASFFCYLASFLLLPRTHCSIAFWCCYHRGRVD